MGNEQASLQFLMNGTFHEYITERFVVYMNHHSGFSKEVKRYDKYVVIGLGRQ